MQVLKHCSTRWLSLERAVNRLLLLWPALFAYFDRETDRSDKDRVKRVATAMRKVETKLYCQCGFCDEATQQIQHHLQTSASNIGTMQEDVRNLLRGNLSNFIQPELQATASNDNIHTFDYENVSNQVSNDELGIGTAARLNLIESSEELEGIRREDTFFLSVQYFYVECVRKIIAMFPFADPTINDLSMLDPCNRSRASTTFVTRMLKRFYKQCSTDDMDAIVMELHEYRLLPDGQLPVYKILDEFWTRMGELPQPAGDEVDKSQWSSLLPSTVCDMLSVKINTDQECFRSKELFTSHLLAKAKSATMHSMTSAH